MMMMMLLDENALSFKWNNNAEEIKSTERNPCVNRTATDKL